MTCIHLQTPELNDVCIQRAHAVTAKVILASKYAGGSLNARAAFSIGQKYPDGVNLKKAGVLNGRRVLRLRGPVGRKRVKYKEGE